MDTRILEIETFALHAWPPELSRELGGWLIRRHPARLRRVNSVWPNALKGRFSLESRIKAVEAVYAGWDRPARYQICPAALPEGLDSALQERGYIVDAPTSVQIAGTRMVLTAAQQRASRWQPFRLKVHDKLSLAWVSAYCLVQGAPPDEAPLRMAALARIVQPAVYVQLDVDGEPAAVGRAVLENGWCGVFGMATRPGFRRRGLATAALDALASQALEMNAGHMYLQVMLDNEAALNCYSGLGFRTLYGYHYRQQPSPGSVT